MVAKNNGSPENVRAQVSTSDLAAGDMLESGPILRRDQDFLNEPFGDGLLPQGRTLEEVREPFGQRGLTTGDLDGALQGSNVRFIHDHPRYTTQVVRVNNPGRVPAHDGGCTVVNMAAQRQKTIAKPVTKAKRIRQAMPGPDGRTFGDRLKVCMAQRARQLGRSVDSYTQKDLIAEATRAVGRDPTREDQHVITQQGLSLILNNKVSESHAAIALAMTLGVEPAWLQYGIGPSNFADRLLGLSKK